MSVEQVGEIQRTSLRLTAVSVICIEGLASGQWREQGMVSSDCRNTQRISDSERRGVH